MLPRGKKKIQNGHVSTGWKWEVFEKLEYGNLPTEAVGERK